MLIDLWRKVRATDYSSTVCGVCGNDFERGSVFAVANTDRGEELGELCNTCLTYLSRRKYDAQDPALHNWPAREWPSLGDLEEARTLYPEPMFFDDEALQEAAGYDPDREDAFIHASFIRTMAPERPRR